MTKEKKGGEEENHQKTIEKAGIMNQSVDEEKESKEKSESSGSQASSHSEEPDLSSVAPETEEEEAIEGGLAYLKLIGPIDEVKSEKETKKQKRGERKKKKKEIVFRMSNLAPNPQPSSGNPNQALFPFASYSHHHHSPGTSSSSSTSPGASGTRSTSPGHSKASPKLKTLSLSPVVHTHLPKGFKSNSDKTSKSQSSGKGHQPSHPEPSHSPHGPQTPTHFHLQLQSLQKQSLRQSHQTSAQQSLSDRPKEKRSGPQSIRGQEPRKVLAQEQQGGKQGGGKQQGATSGGRGGEQQQQLGEQHQQGGDQQGAASSQELLEQSPNQFHRPRSGSASPAPYVSPFALTNQQVQQEEFEMNHIINIQKNLTFDDGKYDGKYEFDSKGKTLATSTYLPPPSSPYRRLLSPPYKERGKKVKKKDKERTGKRKSFDEHRPKLGGSQSVSDKDRSYAWEENKEIRRALEKTESFELVMEAGDLIEFDITNEKMHMTSSSGSYPISSGAVGFLDLIPPSEQLGGLELLLSPTTPKNRVQMIERLAHYMGQLSAEEINKNVVEILKLLEKVSGDEPEQSFTETREISRGEGEGIPSPVSPSLIGSSPPTTPSSSCITSSASSSFEDGKILDSSSPEGGKKFRGEEDRRTRQRGFPTTKEISSFPLSLSFEGERELSLSPVESGEDLCLSCRSWLEEILKKKKRAHLGKDPILCFLMNYTRFIQPKDLVRMLKEISDHEMFLENLGPFLDRLLEDFSGPFTDPYLLRSILEMRTRIKEIHGKDVRAPSPSRFRIYSRQKLKNDRKEKEKEKEKLEMIESQEGLLLCNSTDVLMNELTLAQYLTKFHSEAFCKIKGSELFRLNWLLNPQSSVQNILNIFNQTKSWVVLQILKGGKNSVTPKLFSFFVNLGRRLKELNNFFGCFAVISALTHFTVVRMEIQMAEKTKKKLEGLLAMMNSSDEFLDYRKYFQSTDTTVIPFLPFHLREMVNLEAQDDVLLLKRDPLEDPEMARGIKVINYGKMIGIGDIGAFILGFVGKDDFQLQIRDFDSRFERFILDEICVDLDDDFLFSFSSFVSPFYSLDDSVSHKIDFETLFDISSEERKTVINRLINQIHYLCRLEGVVVEKISTLQSERQIRERPDFQIIIHNMKIHKTIVKEQIYELRKQLLRVYKELEMRKKNIFTFSKEEASKFCVKLPSCGLAPTNSKVLMDVCSGSNFETVETVQMYQDFVCCRTISTYPKLNSVRSGDPVCDRFWLRVEDTRLLFCIADGCNWGYHPALAAQTASTSFIEYLSQWAKNIKSVRMAARHTLRAMSFAQDQIVKVMENEPRQGSTTLIGGLTVSLSPSPLSSSDSPYPCYGFVGASVGDCKLFRWSIKSNEVYEITPWNRLQQDASDCGGRLGAVEDKYPDLRNLGTFFSELEEGDLVFGMSDGVHDNIDPELLSIPPCDVSPERKEKMWGDLEGEDACLLKSKFQCSFLKNVIATHSQKVAQIHMTIMDHCVRTTQSSRNFMEYFPILKLPQDYASYPGKMDHTTLVIFRFTPDFSHSN